MYATQAIIALNALLIFVNTGYADFYFGLGKATANKSKDVIQQSRNEGRKNKLAISGSSPIAAGACGAYTVRLQNADGTDLSATSNIYVSLGDSSAGGVFFSDALCASSIAGVTIFTGSNSAVFYYKKARGGAVTLSASGDGTTGSLALVINYDCGSQMPGVFFSSPLISLGSLNTLIPLGNFNPTAGHVFPTDHLYFNWANGVSADTQPFYSPGNVTLIHVSSVTTQTYGTEYTVQLSPCAEFVLSILDCKSLTSNLLSQIGSFNENSCSDFSTGGITYKTCSKTVSIPLSAGEQLGAGCGDFGPAYDLRVTTSGIISSKHVGYLPRNNIVCPLDYFAPSIKSAMEAKLGSWNGILRTTQPVCGTIAQDVADTAQGHWFRSGQPNSPEDPHMALAHDNIDPTQSVLSIRNSASDLGLGVNTYTLGALKITPDGSRINYDFNLITYDGNIYCAQFPLSNQILLLKLTSSTTLRVGTKNGLGMSCSNTSWEFISNYADFER